MHARPPFGAPESVVGKHTRDGSGSGGSGAPAPPAERDFFMDKLMVRVHSIIEISSVGLAP